ncbi:pentapeptide repeat-containing protein [Schaalia canis]|uniref:Pentapeptide repeat-containing protein n=1 Tax=Schaalia canis TaxID=100469 RepID=A0A3P1SHL2_9ACTO|nr:pentapeptide repeat-containing protein [Schaalia canis]RRC96526.1 pentapeptide repeat-containing protein [Schaalia canis]
MIELKEAGVNRSGKMTYHGVLHRLRVEGIDFSGLALDNFHVADVVLRNCDFSRAKVEVFSPGRPHFPCEFIDCSFDRVNFRQVFGLPNRFVGCSFKGARLSRWKLEETDLVDCDFDGATLRQVIVWGSMEERETPTRPARSWVNEIRGNDFSGARFIDSDFRCGVDLTLQKLPVGPDYIYAEDVPAALARGEEVLEGLDPADRKRAAFLLRMIQDELDNGQKQLFFARFRDHSDSMWFPMREAMNQE